MAASPLLTNPLPARPARFDAGSQHRRSMIAKIQIAKKQLAMAEDDYRQALMDQTGHDSLTRCSDPQLARVLEFMKSKGFSSSPSGKAASHPMARKARALWISLHQLGAVRNPSDQALEAFAKRQLGCEKLRWANQSDAYKLIEALKAMAERAGWPQHSIVTLKQLTPIQLQTSLCEAILKKLKAAGVVPADWALHVAQWRLCGIGEQGSGDRGQWTSEDWSRLAAALGEKLRQHGAAQIATEAGHG
jgi:phage gp16-like protein